MLCCSAFLGSGGEAAAEGGFVYSALACLVFCWCRGVISRQRAHGQGSCRSWLLAFGFDLPSTFFVGLFYFERLFFCRLFPPQSGGTFVFFGIG